MADLKSIQDNLNNDPAERKKFEADPVGYLKSKGVELPASAATHVQQAVKQHAGKTGPAAAWSVGVTVSPAV